MSTHTLPAPPAAPTADGPVAAGPPSAGRSPTGAFGDLLGLLNRLADARIPYTLRHSRHDAVMVEVAVPGERWEIDFLDDGDVDVEVFRSDGEVTDAGDLLDRLIDTHRSDRSDGPG